ncbi:MAG: Rne/Rng family ribonuclease [Flavobacteriales bacterium]|jgi:ribonuclease G|nr:Rne/Rng family ribonuclease [Flavobacteriales bacterium]|tara:strand:+ start:509 stop:2035 length:1527 start_codon:yes stop_codon:yes gene_type:complete
MRFELIIDSRPSEEVVIALLRDKRLIELHKENNNNNYSVGDVYLGKVKKVVPGLNAAFVNVGHEKDGFLHYLDLGPNVNSYKKFTDKVISKKSNTASLKNFRKEKEIDKTGQIADVLKSGDRILVQVSKEPISTKGPRLTTEISIAGRNMVLLPFSNKISLSNKIKSQEEKVRLKRLLKSIKPEGFGVIVRTVAKGKKVVELDSNLKILYKKWQNVFKELKRVQAPKIILKELNRSTAILRDILNEGFNSIHVNDKDLYLELKDYVISIAPEQEKILKLYKSKAPILQNFNVTKQIKSAFGKTVNMKNGTYLVIEHTEAMHVIDVNSGKKVDSKKDQEENALLVNLGAAEEIARQLRLRDMGGIIVVDFIDLYSAKNRKLLFERMREAMKEDKAKHHILPPSKFGLIQITRQRVRPEMNINTRENCPMCVGNGKIDSSLLLIDTIENKIKNLVEKSDNGKIRISTHPFIASHINKGVFSKGMKWSFKYKRLIKINPDDRLHLLQYSIV